MSKAAIKSSNLNALINSIRRYRSYYGFRVSKVNYRKIIIHLVLILVAQLADKVADIVVRPVNEGEVIKVAVACSKYQNTCNR